MGLEIGFFEVFGGLFLFLVVAGNRSVELIGAEMVLPIVKIMFSFEHTESVELASPAILIAVAIKFIAIYLKRHPKYEKRKLVDFKFVSVVMPLVLIGLTWGEVLHAMIAHIFESLLLALITGYLCFVMFRKVRKVFRGELEEDEEEIKPNSVVPLAKEENMSKESNKIPEQDQAPNKSVSIDEEEKVNKNLTTRKMNEDGEQEDEAKDENQEEGGSSNDSPKHSDHQSQDQLQENIENVIEQHDINEQPNQEDPEQNLIPQISDETKQQDNTENAEITQAKNTPDPLDKPQFEKQIEFHPSSNNPNPENNSNTDSQKVNDKQRYLKTIFIFMIQASV